MSVEQGNTIADLVVANPLVEDKVHEGPNHFWLIKRVLKNVFPGAGGQGFNKPILANEDDLNCIEGCSTTEPDGVNWRLKNFIINIKAALTIIDNRLTAIESGGGAGQAAWPVGSIFISYSDQNPAVLLGFGTWTRTAGGRVIVGVADGDPDFGVPGIVGGSKDIDLSVSVNTKQTDTVAGHVHTYSSGSGSANTSTAGSHRHDYTAVEPNVSQPNAALQPYITAYIWKRDA